MPSNYQEWGGRQLMSGKTPDWSDASEYGGVDGIIQPPPHDTKDRAKEQLMLIYNSHPGGVRQDDNSTAADADDVIPDTQLLRGYLD